MEARIRIVGDISSEDSARLRHLAELIEAECGLSVQIEERKARRGVKDGGLVIGIAIASLGVASISAFLTALAYWKSRNPKYSISVSRGGVTESIENLDFQRYQQEVSKLKEDCRVKIDVKIGRK